MNDKDLLSGFRQCKNEIKNLRETNTLLRAKVDTMDRILDAVNSHSPNRSSMCMGEDILWQISKTEDYLEKEIAHQEELSRKVKSATSEAQ